MDEIVKMPFVINPFMPCNSAWDRPMLAYIAKGGEWSGVLLHDYKNFDDGEYAIWGSHDTLALIPYENKIEAQIKQGKRAFMHVLNNSRAVEELETHYARYYSAACLDKVKDYVLDWEDDKNDYPKYFAVKKDMRWSDFYGDYVGVPTTEDMMNILDRDVVRLLRPPGLRRPLVYVVAWQQAEQSVLSLLECGVDQYLTFPVSLQRLRTKVANELDRQL